jgi:hypothetical protein
LQWRTQIPPNASAVGHRCLGNDIARLAQRSEQTAHGSLSLIISSASIIPRRRYLPYIVDQKLSALLLAEARLERTERTSPAFDEICARYRRAEDEYNEAFDAWWWHGAASQSL